MSNQFLFTTEHLMLLIFFAVFLYCCPRLTRNLLPYSYQIEKMICLFIVIEIFLEQATLMHLEQYNVLTSLPIDISRFTAYMAISMLFFKNYQLFNVYFSWSLVCGIGDLIFFKDLGVEFPSFLYFSYIFSKCILIYTTVYLVQVRKFKLSNDVFKDNLKMCLLYFSFIFLINLLTDSTYAFSFSTNNSLSIIAFPIITTLLYIPYIILDKDNFTFNKIKKRSK